MQVHNIQSDDYKSHYSPKFGLLNVTAEAEQLIKTRPDGQKILHNIEGWKKELSKTKYWDLGIHEVCNKLWMTLDSKNDCYTFTANCEAPLGVSAKPEDSNRFYVNGPCIGGGGYTWYRPEFASNEDAQNAYNTLKKYQDMQDISTIDKIAWAVDSVKIMEQSLEYMTGPKAAEGAETQKTKSTKISLGQRFRNAWNAFRKSE